MDWRLRVGWRVCVGGGDDDDDDDDHHHDCHKNDRGRQPSAAAGSVLAPPVNCPTYSLRIDMMGRTWCGLRRGWGGWVRNVADRRYQQRDQTSTSSTTKHSVRDDEAARVVREGKR